MVALPGQLFYTTPIPVCLWFLRKDKAARKGQTLFIDARNLGTMIDRVLRELKAEDIKTIADTYHQWRDDDAYEDVAGFCCSAELAEIEKHGFVLTPGRYVGTVDEEDDGVSFEHKMTLLAGELRKQLAKAKSLDEKIKRNLVELGFSE